MSNLFQINKKDNVAIELEDNCQIKKGHKVALEDIKAGSYVFKYGHIIGKATQDIKKGEWVHSHNLSTHLNEITTYNYSPVLENITANRGYFMGFKRKDRRAGIRNDIYIIPTVGCVNGVVKEIERLANRFIDGTIDSIVASTHQFGCSQLGEDQDNIAKLLSSIALNPNASFVLFVGLGCENNSIDKIKAILGERDNIAYYNAQDVEDEVEHGLNIVKQFINRACELKREKIDLSELCIGLKCGGSDAFSGITANPTVGKVSDRIIEHGGSSILTEVPEMFGAEQILMNKCINKDVFNKYKYMIISFKKYYTDLGMPIYENPSPGNKEGGITTLEEKSLGCITKAGKYPIVDVLGYGDIIQQNGLNVLDGPGNDLIASTALAAAGCQLILFTTGRGTPFSTLVPTIKISSNNRLFLKKKEWIDFDGSTLDDSGLFDLMIKTANGEYRTKQEDSHEIAFFKKGVTL